MKILDRYILRELAGPFLLGAAVFTLLVAAGFILPNLTDLFTEARLGVGDALLLFIYLLPRYVVLTFAMATLLGVLMAFGRLSAESETVAFHAAGASLPRLARPGVAFGVAVSLIALVVGEAVVPQANHAAEKIFKKAKGRPSGIEKNLVLFEKDRQGTERTIYAAVLNLAAGTMERVTINELKDSQPVGGIYAERAKRTGDGWQLFDGYSFTIRGGLPVISVSFVEQTITYLASPEVLVARAKKKPIEMSYRELKTHIAVLRSQERDASGFEVELPRRLALPFASLVFALIGTPLGMRSHRRSSSLGLAFTVLIVFFYYIVWNWLGVAAENGALAPSAAAWLPNIFFAATGLILIFTARK